MRENCTHGLMREGRVKPALYSTLNHTDPLITPRLRTIGEKYQVGQSAVSEASRDFLKKMERDEKLRREVAMIKGKLKI